MTPGRVTQAISWPLVKRSLLVSLIVGTILNLVNQGNALWGDDTLDILRCFLNYLVPFLVASYGGISATISNRDDASQTRS